MKLILHMILIIVQLDKFVKPVLVEYSAGAGLIFQIKVNNLVKRKDTKVQVPITATPRPLTHQ